MSVSNIFYSRFRMLPKWTCSALPERKFFQPFRVHRTGSNADFLKQGEIELAGKKELKDYLKPTEYIDSNNPDIVVKAKELTKDCADDKEKLGKIYYFVRDFPYDILNSFRYLAEEKRRASDVLKNGKAFCMGKASMFSALCRASGIPSRIGFQQLHCPDKPFMNEEVAKIWGDRKLPWHSLGEAFLDGKWLKLDATIDTEYAARKGRKYSQEFDGEHDIDSVEGPLIKNLESYKDYPKDVADWYEQMAKDVVKSVDENVIHKNVLSDKELSGPDAKKLNQTITSSGSA